jgi:hypothetical protein
MNAFTGLPLHDATLLGIAVSWAAREATADIRWSQRPDGGEHVVRLRWTGCSRVVVPHEAPWGTSQSIQSHGWDGERFWLEMQSGDVIEIRAEGFSVEWSHRDPRG